MASETEPGPSGGEDQQITFNVKASNDQKYVLTLPASTTVADLKAKLSTSEYADIPVDRLRLIYSGRVLKDPDTLASTKIKDGHTIHMVKGAASNARQNPAAQSSGTPSSTSTTAPAANVPSNIAAGTGNNPLAALTGARYAGFHGLPSANTFGADGGMGAPPATDDLLRMMEDPNFLQQMNEMMNMPEFQRMLEESPMLRDQPMARQMLRDPAMRRLMFNPQMLRMQMQLQQAMNRGAGGGAFPAPGVTDTTPQQSQAQSGGNAGSQAQNTGIGNDPLAGLFGSPPAGGAQANPFAVLFGVPPTVASPPPPASGATTGTAPQSGNAPAGTASTGPAGQSDLSNTLPFSPEMLSSMLRGFMSADPGAAPGRFGMTPQAPPDTRPPEERYADQLRQLNDMGFYEFERNIEALRRSGGSVEGAVEYLLSGGGAP